MAFYWERPLGAIVGGKAADLFGRRRVLLVTATFFGIGALASAAAPSPAILIVSRIVLGLAIGLASTNVPVYLSEVAPPYARGWVVSLFQLAVTVGIVVAYLTDYAFAGVEGWRWMLGLAVVPALVFGTSMFFLPETPRWLIPGWRAWPEFPHLKSVRTACLDRSALPDGLCRFISDQSRTHLLPFDRRDLSAKNSRPCRGHGGHVQLGIEPDRFAYVSDIGRETRCELDVFALRVCLGGVVALRLLFCSGNEAAHVGTDRSLLECKAWRAPRGTPNFLTQSPAIMRFPKVKHGADGNDASRIDLRVRHVVVALNVIEIDGVCDAWMLI